MHHERLVTEAYPFTGCWGGDGGVIEGAEERARYWGSSKEVFRPLDAKDACAVAGWEGLPRSAARGSRR